MREHIRDMVKQMLSYGHYGMCTSTKGIFRGMAACCALSHFKPEAKQECNGVNVWISDKPEEVYLAGTTYESFQFGDQYLNFVFVTNEFTSDDTEEWVDFVRSIRGSRLRASDPKLTKKDLYSVSLDQLRQYIFNSAGILRFGAKYSESPRLELTEEEKDNLDGFFFSQIKKGCYLTVNKVSGGSNYYSEIYDKIKKHSKVLYESPLFLNKNYHQYTKPYLQLAIVEFE